MEIITFTVIGVLSRLLPHIPNMTAVGATSLFMGAKYGVKKSMIVLLVTMLMVDSVKGLHSVMWATYGSLFVAILIGKYVASRKGMSWIIGGALTSSILFFVITNFAVWLAPNFMYPKTLSGLMECYAMAIPFFRNTIMGDVVYTSVFFGGFELVRSIREKYLLRRSVKA
jgi:hypothetical protein